MPFYVFSLQRLFFCNGEQDLSAFLLVDLGIVKYPTYNCIVTDQMFSSRTDLLSYEEVLLRCYLFLVACSFYLTNIGCQQALEVAQIMDESLEEYDSSAVLRCIATSTSRISSYAAKTVKYSCFSALWVYSKVAFLGVSFLESERRYRLSYPMIILLANWMDPSYVFVYNI